MAREQLLPRFEVEKLEGDVKAYRYVKTENGLEVTETVEPAGYMIYFPQGHSIRVSSDKMLRFLGFHRIPGMAMLSEGEQTEDRDVEDTPSLKQLSSRMTKHTGRRASPQED